MDLKDNLGSIMREAKKMQERMQEAQEELANLLITGESGGGLVKIDMNGRHDCKRVDINKSLLDEEADMLEDLIAAAINDAVQKVEKASKEKIG